MRQKILSSLILAATIHLGCITIAVAQPVETSATNTMTTMPLADETTATITQEELTTQPATSVDNQTTQTVADAATSVTLPGGTLYQVLKMGSGALASTTGTRLIHYTLFLTDGTKLESSRDAEFPVPFQFVPGEGQAIKGMEEGTNDMRVGEMRKLYVPADQGYGENAHGNVPPNSSLVFTIELVDIK